jgi:hypothetical protein
MKNSNSIRVFVITIVLITAALACNAPAAAPTPDLAVAVAQTQTAIAVAQFLTATIPAPTAQDLPVVATTAVPATPSSTPVIQASPTPTTQPAQINCTDQAKYVSETIPDNSTFAAGEKFMKTWTLQNSGTCTWTPDYSLIFFEGDQMEGTSPAPIGQTVAPNGTIQLYLPQTAPAQPGTFQGFWKLKSPSGREFALGQNADKAFWVKINVSATAPTSSSGGPLNLGAPTWSESFDNGSGGFFTGSDNTTDFEVSNGSLVMTAPTPKGDNWRISIYVLSDGYIEGKFRTGETCSGKDSYGFILRAPDQPDSIIDSGYIFAFSCEGKYRIYRMDNGSFTSIKGWTAASAIQAGPDKANTMGVYAKADKLQLYANNVLLFEFNDGVYSTGYLGLMIGGQNTNNFQVFVDQVSYWNQVQ